MKDVITIPRKQYECLRGHLEEAAKIFNSLGIPVGSLSVKDKAPNREPKETKTQKVNKYKKLIESGQRVKKPDHLKK
jgi:ethanolamine utilization cobalamin adenosyltransferase